MNKTTEETQERPQSPAQTAERFPLSFAQQRLWFLDQLDPGGSTYNTPRALRIRGPLNIDVLHRALAGIVDRHESLRTTFVATENEPVQVVAVRRELPMPVVDLRRMPAATREAEAQRLITEEARRPFDLTQGPLMRVGLLQLREEEHILMLTVHHIVSDGWSIRLLFRELGSLYEAFSQGRPSPLAELPIQYPDYAVWQRENLKGERLDRQLAYWKEHLAGAPALLELPTDRPRPPVQTFHGEKQSIALPESLSQALKALSRRENATLFMTLLAAFKVLLFRYSGQPDIVVGAPIAGRTHANMEELIGYFANTLILRTDLSGDPTFRGLLKRVRAAALGAYAHQELPFEKLVEALQPARDLSYNPLFQVLFGLHNLPPKSLALSNLTLDPVEVDKGTARFDLALDLQERPDGIGGSLEYNTDLFDAATITRMLGHFQTLLQSIAADPDQRLSILSLLTEAERRQLSEQWNGAPIGPADDRCLHELFEAQVARAPDAVAVVFEGHTLTYRELNQRANRLAHHLRKLGVKAEVPVGICVERSLDMVVGLVAILKAGGAYVPLDPDYPTERLAYMLEDIQAPVLVTQRELVHRLPQQTARVVCLNADREIIAEESDENLPTATTPDNLAYVIYTSGSTGRPKGVQICHRSVFRLLEATRPLFGFGEHDVWTVFHSYGFDFSVWEIWGALLQGGRLVVVPRETAQSPAAFSDLLRRERVTVLNQTPSAMRQLIEVGGKTTANGQAAGSSHAARVQPDAFDDLSLRLIVCGGEAFPPELVSPILEWNVPVWNFYGPTESTVWAAIHPITPRSGCDSILIGRPIGDRQIYLLDGNLQLVPVGVAGELHIGGAGLARGYWNRPELTAEKFIPDPFTRETGGRLYKTGDRARYLPDGALDFLGRLDNQVKIRGFRIELGEIETVLTQHRAVRAAVVIVREDASATKRLIAYIVPDRQQAYTISDLHAFLKEKLPDYMIPSAVVALDALPLTANGKVDRRALPAPDQTRPDLEQAFAAPRTPTEELLAEIWSDLLQVESVGVHDNFFELGGHSLLATQIVSRLRTAFTVEISLHAFFQTPTIAALAKHVETARRTGRPLQGRPLRPIPRDRALPLSFAQERLWFMNQLEPDSPAYNIPQAVRMRGPLKTKALQKSLDAIVARHETLRTAFVATDGIPRQIISKSRSIELGIIDLSERTVPDRETETARLLKEKALLPFNLSSDLMLRATLIRLDDEEHALLLVMHHIASDGWSIANLCRELAVLYEAFSSGHPSPLPDLTIQYADFAAWEREELQGEALENELSYWRRQLAGVPTLLELPTDHPRPSVRTSRGSHRSFVLSKSVTDALKALSRQEGATLFMTLLSAFQILLYRYTKQHDFVVGTPIAGRNQTEIEGLIGFFVNALLLRADLSGDPTFRKLLERVREVTLAAYAHQQISVTKLVEALRPERSLSHTAISQVSFSFQNNPTRPMELAGLNLSPIHVGTGTTKTDLTLVMRERPEGLTGRLEYNADLFQAGTVSRIVTCFQTLLENIAADPERRLSQLAHSTEAPRSDTNDDIENPQPEDGNELFEESYPLSPMQQGMIFHSLYAPQSGVDIEQMVCELQEEIDPRALQRAWQRVVERHAALRTSFHVDTSGEPLQKTQRHIELTLEKQDWRALSRAEREAKLKTYMTADRQRGFDLSRAPLMRLALFRTAQAEYQFVWSFHHALLDGRAFSLVLKEVFDFYEAFRRGMDLKLARPRPYRDYIDWLGQRDLSRAEAFWRQTLRGFTAPTPLPVTNPGNDPTVREETHAKQETRLSVPLTSALQAFARQHQLTLNTIVQGAWAVLLSRYSGEEDIVFGATRACRRSTVDGAEAVVGVFINTLPVRTRVAPDRPLLPWLKELRAQQLAVREYEHTPLVELQRWSELPGGVPLFESILVFENYHLNADLRAQGGGWEKREFRLVEQTNYPLTLAGYAGAELLLEIAYDRRRFDDASVTRMLDHLRIVLEAIAANPEQRLSDLPFLTEAERRQLLVEWNDTQREYSTDRCIHRLFEAQAERTPEAVAVAFEEQRMTYRELNATANGVARLLTDRGIGRGCYVPFLMDRSIEVPIAMLAIMKAGAAFVPLDIHWPLARIQQILEDLNSDLVLVNQTTPHDEEALGRSFLRVHEQTSIGTPPGNPNLDVNSEEPIYAIYTSGSTGKPKGAVVPHRGITNRFLWMNEFFGPATAAAVLQTTYHVYDSAVWQLFWPLINGGKTVIPAPGTEADADYLADLIDRNGVSMTDFVPSVFNAIVPQLTSGESMRGRLQSLRTIVVGGEEITRETTHAFMAQFPAVRVVNLYGPTEASIGCICHELNGRETGKIPIGRPISNVHVAILDRSGNPVPQGVAGELYLSGVCLGLGYLNDEEKTKAAFVVNSLPEIDCGRLYKTGDLVRYLSDGNIEFLGRIDHQVKIRGFRIEPGEIETALRDHNAVQEAVVIAIENGSGGKRLVGYVVSGQAPVPTAGDLRDFLKQSLPEYMVPSTFMFLDSLPLTAGGKLDRKALPPPDLDGLELEQTFIAPRTPIEEKLAEIWSQVLKLERVGVNDNFFELGGHSLLATQLMSRIRSAFQMDLPLRSLFASPTVAHLSETIVQSLAEGAEPDETENMLSRIESLSLNEAQHLLSHEDSTRAKR